jgi:protein SDA1
MAALPDRLSALQNVVKRDPASYADEYRAQARAFDAELALVRLRLSADSASFRALALFIAHCAPSFPGEPCALPEQLSALLSEHAAALAPDVRRAAAKALVLLRARGVISAPVPLIERSRPGLGSRLLVRS